MRNYKIVKAIQCDHCPNVLTVYATDQRDFDVAVRRVDWRHDSGQTVCRGH